MFIILNVYQPINLIVYSDTINFQLLHDLRTCSCGGVLKKRYWRGNLMGVLRVPFENYD